MSRRTKVVEQINVLSNAIMEITENLEKVIKTKESAYKIQVEISKFKI